MQCGWNPPWLSFWSETDCNEEIYPRTLRHGYWDDRWGRSFFFLDFQPFVIPFRTRPPQKPIIGSPYCGSGRGGCPYYRHDVLVPAKPEEHPCVEILTLPDCSPNMRQNLAGCDPGAPGHINLSRQDRRENHGTHVEDKVSMTCLEVSMLLGLIPSDPGLSMRTICSP